jgi:hypothetical protein
MHRLKPILWTRLYFESCIAVGLIFLVLMPVNRLFAEEGFGPPISIPRSVPTTNATFVRNLIDQPLSAKESKSRGCVFCHKGIEEMHSSPNVVLGCTDCHGGNPNPGLTMAKAHVQPRHPVFWKTSANPVESSVLLNHESAEFIRFVNPADLRVADQVCGTCHKEIIGRVHHSMMNHGAMLWGAALYNNGAVPHKDYRFGQAYGADGAPLRLLSPGPVSPEETRLHGELPFIEPLPRFPIGQPGNILRIFERGGEKQTQLGIPNPFEPPGKPARRLGERGLGTLNRIDPVVLNLQKTRLHDPLLGFMGSNDHPGDYRSSGCSACHVVYANDRSPSNAGWYSKFGNQGLSFSGDQSGLRKNERGHPIKHQFTRSIPSSQCITCHMHQGNLFVNPYLGYTWWDQESDGEFMYPKKQKNPTDAEFAASLRKNPEAAAAKGLWGDLDFLEKVAELNPKLKNTQFADYHGHGWIFRAVFKKDRKGNLLTLDDEIIPSDATNKFARAVHLKDVHLARGMQCVDCHFDLDVHGNGKLYGEPRAATAIECIDCHGTISKRPSLVTSGNAKTMAGDPIDLAKTSTPWGPRFEWEGKKLFQHSMMSPDTRWEIPQTVDTIDPNSSHYNAKSAYAKTIQRDGKKWGGACQREEDLAHSNGSVSCQICHTSWATSCFGCHLPMRANQKVPADKYEGITTRNYTSYNPQVVRDDVFMLGIDGTVKSNRLAVLRSSSAVIVGSQNANREWVYSQQQTVSAEGYSGQAFNPHFPHTTSSVGTTRGCSDCHVAKENNNNAIMAQLLGFGTGTVNFFGRYAYVGEGRGGLDGVIWTEQDEPQAAIGSHLHHLAYPDNFAKHEAAGRKLETAYHHEGKEILDLTLRGEYLYTANGEDGFEVFDVANIDQKGFSERIVSSPVSPIGQRTHVPTKYATSVALPSTLGIDPARSRLPENEEQKIHMLYGYVYITDREEGLVMVNVATLVDGDPANNFLPKKIVFNPGDKLHGATHCYVAGRRLFVTAERGLFIIDIDDPEHPSIISEVTSNFLNKPRAVGVQFRYAFVTDADGLKVIDITDPVRPRPINEGVLALKNAQRFYLARTYAYVANGNEGLAIVDIENPEKPGLVQMFNADGLLNDTRAVQIGSVNASEYGLVADGKNGLRVLQLISPDTVAEHMGFSPKPQPRLIATYQTHSPAVAVSRGLDRDRVVDESGNQTVVFGRRGARPFSEREMKKFYQHDKSANDNPSAALYTVEDIVSRNGHLSTWSGEALEPTVPFAGDPVEQPVRPPVDRLVRRPE